VAAGDRCKSDYATAEQAAYATKNAANILRYPLIKTSSGVITIRKWILQEDWYTSAQSSFISDARSDKLTANALCLTTAEKVTELGLNDIDAALVTWAMMKGLPPARAMDPTAWTAPRLRRNHTKSRLVRRAELGRVIFDCSAAGTAPIVFPGDVFEGKVSSPKSASILKRRREHAVIYPSPFREACDEPLASFIAARGS